MLAIRIEVIAGMVRTSWPRLIADWLLEHQAWLWWVGAASLAMMVLGALLLPWLICRIPADYFTDEYVARRCQLRRAHTWRSITLLALRNLLGVVLIIAGIAMLFLPGQGILTILIGLLLLSLPRKRRMVRAIACRRTVCRPLNWLREKRGHSRFEGLAAAGESPAKPTDRR